MGASADSHKRRGPRQGLMLGLPGLALALLLAGAGQTMLDRRTLVPAGFALLLGAAALFGRRAPAPSACTDGRIGNGQTHVRWLMVVVAVILGELAAPLLRGNRYTLPGAAVWIASLACMACALWPADWRPHLPSWPLSITLTGPGLLVIVAVLVGAFLRLYRIHTLPGEMGCDLPLIQGNIAQILSGQFPIFFESYPGREGLFFYLAAPVTALAGLNYTSIKVAAALIGVLTIPALYLLGRELFDGWTGALSAFLLAMSHWHIILSRTGYRAVLMPLLVALGLFFLVRGLRTGSTPRLALSAAVAGLCLQTYNACMVVPPLLLGILLYSHWRGKSLGIKLPWRTIALWVLIVVLVALPLLVYVLENPQGYFYRVSTRATSTESQLPGNVVAVWAGNVARALAQFNYRGDAVYVTNVPEQRELGYATAVCFMLGAGYCGLGRARKRGWLLLVVLGALLLPSTLALAFPSEVPSAVRSIGALVPAMLIAGLGLRLAWQWLVAAREMPGARHPSLLRVLSGGLAALLVGAVLAETVAVYPLYFDRYRRAQLLENRSISLEMARALDDYSDGDAYILIAPFWYDGNAVRAQLERRSPDTVHELYALEQGAPPLDDATQRVMVILHPDEHEALTTLAAWFPGHLVLDRRWDDGSVAFQIFYGER